MTNNNIFVCKDNFVYHLISAEVAEAMLRDKTGTYEIDAISTEDESCVEISTIEELKEREDSQFALAIGFRDRLTPDGKPLSIYDSVETIKQREQRELREALRKYGDPIDDGYEFHFVSLSPIVAAYNFDDPCDVVITAARMDSDGFITLIGHDNNFCDDEDHDILADDIFAGQMDYITQLVKA